MNDDGGFAAFMQRTAVLGLALDEEDLAELYRGWQGLQPQLARVRQGLAEPTAEGSDAG